MANILEDLYRRFAVDPVTGDPLYTSAAFASQRPDYLNAAGYGRGQAYPSWPTPPQPQPPQQPQQPQQPPPQVPQTASQTLVPQMASGPYPGWPTPPQPTPPAWMKKAGIAAANAGPVPETASQELTRRGLVPQPNAKRVPPTPDMTPPETTQQGPEGIAGKVDETPETTQQGPEKGAGGVLPLGDPIEIKGTPEPKQIPDTPRESNGEQTGGRPNIDPNLVMQSDRPGFDAAGMLGGFGNWLQQHSNTLLAIGAGLAGAPSIHAGLGRAAAYTMPAAQQDIAYATQNAQQQASYNALFSSLQASGMDARQAHNLAMAGATNPKVFDKLSDAYITPNKYEFKDVETQGLFGTNKRVMAINPRDPTDAYWADTGEAAHGNQSRQGTPIGTMVNGQFIPRPGSGGGGGGGGPSGPQPAPGVTNPFKLQVGQSTAPAPAPAQAPAPAGEGGGGGPQIAPQQGQPDVPPSLGGTGTGFFAPGFNEGNINMNATGDDFLNQFSPFVQNDIKGALSGRFNTLGRQRYGQAINTLAQTYGAGIGQPYDPFLVNQRKAYEQELGGTTKGVGLKAYSLGQGLDHFVSIADKMMQAHLSGFPWKRVAHGINALKAESSAMEGLENEVGVIGQGLAGETGKLMSGTQAGGVHERGMMKGYLSNIFQSRQGAAGSMEGMLDLLKGGIDELEADRNRKYGDDPKYWPKGSEFMTDKERAQVAHIEEVIEGLKSGKTVAPMTGVSHPKAAWDTGPGGGGGGGTPMQPGTYNFDAQGRPIP